jgi:hypothetical protein
VLALGWIPTQRWSAYVIVTLYTAIAAVLWPALEAAIVGSRRSRSALPDRLGVFNIIWSTLEATGCVVSGALFAWRPDSMLWAPGAFHLAQWLGWISTRPRDDVNAVVIDPDPHRGEAVPREAKRTMMLFHWIGNALAYS